MVEIWLRLVDDIHGQRPVVADLLELRQQPDRDSDGLQKVSLTALARQQVDRATGAGGRHTADTVYGGHEKVLRQTVIGISQGARLAEHENPGEATVQVLHGRVRMIAGGQS